MVCDIKLPLVPEKHFVLLPDNTETGCLIIDREQGSSCGAKKKKKQATREK